MFCACGVVGVDETKASCGLFGFIGCKGFAGQMCSGSSFGLFLFLWHAVGYLEQHLLF